MGASDILSGHGPRFGSRVLVDSTLIRRSIEPETHGRRPPVLQRSHGAIQLSLFDNLEPHTQPIDVPHADPVPGVVTQAVEPACEPIRPAD